MNNQEAFRKKIKELVIKNIETEEINIDIETDLREHGMNSINCIKIIVAIEDFYGFEFDDEDLILENFVTINNLAEYVNRKITKLTR